MLKSSYDTVKNY